MILHGSCHRLLWQNYRFTLQHQGVTAYIRQQICYRWKSPRYIRLYPCSVSGAVPGTSEHEHLLLGYSPHFLQWAVAFPLHKCCQTVNDVYHTVRGGKRCGSNLNGCGSCHNEFRCILPGTDSPQPDYRNAPGLRQPVHVADNIVYHPQRQRFNRRPGKSCGYVCKYGFSPFPNFPLK